MRLSFLFLFLSFFSFNCTHLRGDFSLSGYLHVTLWRQVEKLLKSKHVQGAGLGMVSAGITNLVIKSFASQRSPFPKAPLSFFATLAAAAYGAYSSNDPKEIQDVFFHALVASVILGAAHTVHRELRESYSEEIIFEYGLKENSKAGLKQALLSFVAFITSYYSTLKPPGQVLAHYL